MKKLRIAYQPFSKNLSHPGDRRRVVFWAERRGHTLVTDINDKADVVILSERADFGAFPHKAPGAPIILDLIDGYLAPGDYLTDLGRGVSKVFFGQISGIPKPFTSFIKVLCTKVSGVICSTPEQLATISPFSSNIHTILDSHHEFPIIPFTPRIQKSGEGQNVLWEGLPATLSGVKEIKATLNCLSEEFSLSSIYVTDLNYNQFLGRYWKRDTRDILKRNLGHSYETASLVPWSKENLISSARSSSLAAIPINLSSPLQYLKPENRLLIMWRLGLPCLTSESPAYSRVSKIVGSDTICVDESDWTSKMTTLLTRQDIAEQIVINGQRYIRENMNEEILLEKWDNAVASVL
jgi:hypothetical protein